MADGNCSCTPCGRNRTGTKCLDQGSPARRNHATVVGDEEAKTVVSVPTWHLAAAARLGCMKCQTGAAEREVGLKASKPCAFLLLCSYCVALDTLRSGT